ncbi:MAG: hypothetical protein KME05_24440 [Gloeocapsa sp. UFS-A4-WI-NPMV-4B04]|jgi:hypothetical protein|nr:hypothetical protein [Gloeocapsa sp. UFS-A4-WI-NPMV-4B04]
MFSLEALFCHVDDFCGWFEPRFQQQLLSDDQPRRRRSRSLSLSETLTILIAFHSSAYRNFKAFYTQKVCVHWHSAFPGLVSKRALCRMDAFRERCRYVPTYVTALVSAVARVSSI